MVRIILVWHGAGNEKIRHFASAADAPLLSLRDIFPVSSGKPAPKGKASKNVI